MGKRLGRGLADLIPVGGDSEVAAAVDLSSTRTVEIADLYPNPNQPRTHFDENALVELADSIRANGILQPLLVRPRTDGGWQIVAGERRWRAARLAGLSNVPVVIRELNDAETLALALIENLIRADIGPLETARAFRRLMDDFDWTQEEMARRVGKSRSAVANSLRLLHLPNPILSSIERGEISEGHARALMLGASGKGLTDNELRARQLVAWSEIMSGNLSVRETERLMEGTSTAEPTEPTAEEVVPPVKPLSPPILYRAGSVTDTEPLPMPVPTLPTTDDIRSIEDRMREQSGLRVRVLGDGVRGTVELHYYTSDDLTQIMQMFGILEVSGAGESDSLNVSRETFSPDLAKPETAKSKS